MRNTHDTPDVERILAEQEAEYPEGTPAVLRTPSVSDEPELRAEMNLVREWKAGRMGLVALMTGLEALQRKAIDVSVNTQ